MGIVGNADSRINRKEFVQLLRFLFIRIEITEVLKESSAGDSFEVEIPCEDGSKACTARYVVRHSLICCCIRTT